MSLTGCSVVMVIARDQPSARLNQSHDTAVGAAVAATDIAAIAVRRR
jgi:hypothetical protein